MRSLLALGLLELVALAALGWAPGAARTPWPALALWGAAFAAYAAAARALEKGRIEGAVGWTADADSGTTGRWIPPAWAVWAPAIAMRLALLPLDPHLSDDVYRYLWDGWVQLAGTNPYLHAPADPVLAPLRTGWHDLINHPGIPTIYPPAAQLAFAALAALSPAVLVWKVAWVAADLAVGWVLGRLAGAARLAQLLWLWSPLVVVEVAWSGHVEPLGILCMVAAVWAAERGRSAAAGALLGIGGGIKLAPLAGLPALWRRHGAVAAGAALAALAAVSIPYLEAGERALAGLTAWATRWEFDPGAYRVLVASGLPGDAVRLAAAAAVAGLAVWAAARRWPLRRTLTWTIGAALLLSPTLHPWYALWILPFAALGRIRGWLWLTGAVALSYWGLDAYQATGSWPLPLWIPFAVHGPTIALLALDARERDADGKSSGYVGRPWPMSAS